MANSVNRYFEGLLVGGLLGLIAGLLTAPKPGSTLRRELSESADDLMKNGNERWINMKDRVSEQIHPLAERASEYGHQLRDMAEQRTSQLKVHTDRLKAKASDIKHKLSSGKQTNGTDLMNNYMGNNSGPVYTAGHKVSPDASAYPVSDAHSSHTPGKAAGGAAGG